MPQILSLPGYWKRCGIDWLAVVIVFASLPVRAAELPMSTLRSASRPSYASVGAAKLDYSQSFTQLNKVFAQLKLQSATQDISVLDSDLPRLEIKRPSPMLRRVKTTVTAYSSVPWATDSTPYQTASGACVQDGIVAANFLEFGTRLRMPEVFGEKIFEVQDRMNARYPGRVDVWMRTPRENRQFGIKRDVLIEIISDGDGRDSWKDGWTNKECQTQLAST